MSSVLEGSVRKVGNRIRITAQLINVANGYHLWSETYDRQLEDVFAIQDEISRAIVDALKLRLGGDGGQLVAPTQEPRGLHPLPEGAVRLQQVHRAGLRKALDFFQQSLLQDPGYARAYAGIADCWCELADDWVAPDEAYPRAKAAADARAAARPRPGRGDDLGRQGAVLVRVGFRRVGAAAPPRGLAERQLRRGALGLRERAADRGSARRGGRGDAEGAHPRSALRGVQPMARSLPACSAATIRGRSRRPEGRWT